MMNITNGLLGISLILGSIVMSGCASQPKLTNEQIMNQHQEIAALDSALKQAKSKGSEYLAPEGYANASEALGNAMDFAESNLAKNAQVEAVKGLDITKKVNRDSETSRKILAEVLSARKRAYDAGAKVVNEEKIRALDEELKQLATLIENGNVEKAKQNRPKLTNEYAQVELLALKKGRSDLAKTSIANAKEQGAKRYAPKTLARAEEEMAFAVNILDVDRSQTTKAEVHAKKAKWLADKSASITETIKDFDRRDYTREDVVLWHQQQLQVVNEPLGNQLPFNESDEKVTLSLRNSISDLVSDIAQLKAKGEQYNQKIALTEKELALTEKQRQANMQQDRENQQKFDSIQAMFSGSEANVYRQRQNVLIAAHGFAFPPGQSEIQAGNFPLMNKIIRAIQVFPNARIEVNGHTDSMGDERINQKLSDQRAEKVAKFLTELGGIEASKISSRGFGELRPVASNETRDGRAENRRVEIKIVNE